MLLTSCEYLARAERLQAGAFLRCVGAHSGLERETSALAALLPSVVSGLSELKLTEYSDKVPWLGDLNLYPASPTQEPGRLQLKTSGTTGVPKEIAVRLSDRVKSTKQDPDARWLMCYQAGKWAWVSLTLHAVASSGSIVIPSNLSPLAILDAGIKDMATHIGLTPSMFRLMMLAEPSNVAKLPIKQVTLGGEYATQALLDSVMQVWPKARVTHVLATTETGDICSASDGKEGFPWPRVQRAGGSLSSEGELLVHGAPTGDFWELADDRMVFLGRREEIINVGGIKVSPIQVEAAALEVPGVTGAAAFPLSSLILGQMVGLEVSGLVSEGEVRRALHGMLPKVARPALVRVVSHIELSDAGKTMRRNRETDSSG